MHKFIQLHDFAILHPCFGFMHGGGGRAGGLVFLAVITCVAVIAAMIALMDKSK